MRFFIPLPNSITPAWLTAMLRQAGVLAQGEVRAVSSETLDAFNSQTSRLLLEYNAGSPSDLPASLILKRNIPEAWGVEAGAEEVAFYQLMGSLQPAPPAIVPCYAAHYNAASGESYLLLRDLSATHAPPVTRDQQMSIVKAVPPSAAIDQVIETLARHHAYWWNHALLHTGPFEVGYWSRDADRFAQYLQRRTASWESLLANEADWFPDDLREFYEQVFVRLREHWQHSLEPRFRTRTHLTLVHGDAYFANFLCPNHPSEGATYLLDWQSPVVDIGGYDLANLCATFWTSEQRHEDSREQQILRHYLATLEAYGVRDYGWDDLVADYRAGLIYWLLVPLQDRYDGAGKDYWWPKMQCLVAAFREWRCTELLGMV